MDSMLPAALLNRATYRIRDMGLSYGNCSIKDISEHGLNRASYCYGLNIGSPKGPCVDGLVPISQPPPVLKFPSEEAALGGEYERLEHLGPIWKKCIIEVICTLE